jgi:hypothetical protein
MKGAVWPNACIRIAAQPRLAEATLQRLKSASLRDIADTDRVRERFFLGSGAFA